MNIIANKVKLGVDKLFTALKQTRVKFLAFFIIGALFFGIMSLGCGTTTATTTTTTTTTSTTTTSTDTSTTTTVTTTSTTDTSTSTTDTTTTTSSTSTTTTSTTTTSTTTTSTTTSTTTTTLGVHWQLISTGISSSTNLNDVVFLDANKAFAVGDGGTIEYSADGGSSWSQVDSKTTFNLSTIAAASGIAYACGKNGTIVKYDGSAWALMSSPTTETLMDICFISSLEGFVFSAGNRVYKTTDGSTWTALANQVGWGGPAAQGIYFTDSNTGVAVGNGGQMKFTLDGGTTSWNGMPMVTNNTLRKIQFFSYAADNNIGWAVGDNGTINYCHGALNTWSTTECISGVSTPLKSIFALNTREAWVVGNAGNILHTTNTTTWTSNEGSGLVGSDLNGVSFIDSTHGLAVGNSGIILKYSY